VSSAQNGCGNGSTAEDGFWGGEWRQQHGILFNTKHKLTESRQISISKMELDTCCCDENCGSVEKQGGTAYSLCFCGHMISGICGGVAEKEWCCVDGGIWCTSVNKVCAGFPRKLHKFSAG
jgi:hypothetical protein